MTATRDPDRLLRAWLDLMPDEVPDRTIAAVLQATAAAPQARALSWHGPRRSRMNRLTMIAAAAAVLAALVGGAMLLSSGRPGLTTATAKPTPGAPTLNPTPPNAVAPMPAVVLGIWVADADSIVGLTTSAQQLQLVLNPNGGLTAWVQLAGDDGRLAVQSSSLAAPDGEIWLRADVGAFGCLFGDDGRYRWDRSADGTSLTLRLIEDACVARGAALARTWRSDLVPAPSR